VIDWNAYRTAYDRMSFADVVAFHDKVWDKHPIQEHYSPAHLAAFFANLGGRVLEVGGWRGEAARQILSTTDIIRWDNYEICRGAAESPVTDDPRYRSIHPTDWPWLLPVGDYEVAVLAHVIEHIRANQLALLVGWLEQNGVENVYVESPLRDIGRSWRGQSSAHVLEIGWPEVTRMFARSGYRVDSRDSAAHGEVLCLRR
jgi:hypothetical protein